MRCSKKAHAYSAEAYKHRMMASEAIQMWTWPGIVLCVTPETLRIQQLKNVATSASNYARLYCCRGIPKVTCTHGQRHGPGARNAHQNDDLFIYKRSIPTGMKAMMKHHGHAGTVNDVSISWGYCRSWIQHLWHWSITKSSEIGHIHIDFVA